MRRILFTETNLNELPAPPSGYRYIGFDGPTFSIQSEIGTLPTSVVGPTGPMGPTGTGGGDPALSEVTYSELVNMIDEGELTTGKFYKITNFKTCYDQPNYNVYRNAISTGNYKVGNTHSIIVFAISSDKLSVDAWQPDFPKDRIKYDINYSTTYTTGGTAFGRITERVDEWNNRTDYDHREVLFRRYRHYYPDLMPLSGTIDMIQSGTVSGINTQFDVDFSVDDYLFLSEDLGLVYKITQISSSQSMSVTGSYIPNVNGSNYHKGYRTSESNLDGYLQYYQSNVDGAQDYQEFHTFKLGNETIVNNKFGDFYSLTEWNETYFDLPNNVFGEDVISSIFGASFENNTFVDDVEETRIGDYCRNNIYYSDESDFDDNVIGNFFQNNTILDRFAQNSIKNYFENNYIRGNFEDNFVGDDFSGNRINNNYVDNNVGNSFENNKIYENFEDNKIGNGFNNNTIEDSFYDNTISLFFEYNHTYSSFNRNTIGNSFAQNNIYSDFYENNIGLSFGGNLIGDSGNLGEINFYRNRIGNNFQDNNIRQDFQNNQIGNNFQENNAYGDFYKNVIGNGFNNNGYIGHDFYGNHIGNGYNNNNYIGDYFYNNKIGEYFEDNYITNNFRENSIGNSFENNTLGDTQYFTWNDTTIENLTERNYTTFDNSLYGDDGNNIGNVILGKELIMHFTRNSGTTMSSGNLIIGESYEITNYQGTDDFTDVADIQSGVINTNGCVFIATGPTVSNWSSGSELTELTSYDEYHKVKFTQWTQNNNGGGFSYERTEVYPNSGDTVYFTKLNYGSEVDVIIPGRLEIRRDNNGAIYNYAEEGEWDENISPEGTEWNSIYTHQNQGGFDSNEIQNLFKGNLILGEFFSNKIGFGFLSNNLYGFFVNNKIDDNFDNNDINSFDSNRVGVNFENNTIGENFYNNEIGINFNSNNISSEFSNNKIGAYFENNNIEEGFGVGYGNSQKNIIDDYFQNNNIGEYFYNNKVASYFQNNNVGYYFQRNNIDIPIFEEDFIVNYGNILAFTYQSSGTTSTPGFYNISGTTSGHGESASFGITVSGGTISTISLVSAGNQYEVGNTISIPGTQIGGVSRAIGTFSINSLSVKIYTPADSTYPFPDNETEMDYLIDNSPLFDTYYSSNIQGVSYTTKTGVNQTQYAMVIEGYIKIPSSGTYSFGLSSDDGSDAFINGIRVADWYGAHGESGNVPGGTQSPISLTAGTYPVKVRLQQRNGQDIVILLYSLDGVSWNIIPDNWFTPDITGITGSYPGIFATGGTGEGATFDVEVIGGLVDSVVLSNGGGSYSVGNVLTISGDEFGGTQSIIINVDSLYSDDVTITVTEVGATPSVYGDYNTNIFRNGGGNLRLSYFDGDDVLTIKNINE